MDAVSAERLTNAEHTAAILQLAARDGVRLMIPGGFEPRGRSAPSQPTNEGDHMTTGRVDLPSVHMAGSDQHHAAHIEVGPHGFALFLSPDAESPVLDVNGTREQLDAVVRGLEAALASRP
jgi:hypothetical protein